MRQSCAVIASSTWVISMFLLQGCAATWWWGSESEQEGPAQVELIKEPAMKEIPPDDRHLAGSRRSSAMQSELFSRNANGLASETLSDIPFEFDQDTIRTEAMHAIESNVKELRHEQVKHLMLEGRGDEFGTSAYNLVLGERRARNVQSYLRELGLSFNLTTISYGKDHPLCFENSDECRQRNRSVHFVVK